MSEFYDTYSKELTKTECKYFDPLRVHSMDGMDSARILHGALGLITEVDEYLMAKQVKDAHNVCEELGDLFWFAGIIAKGIGLDYALLLEEWRAVLRANSKSLLSGDAVEEMHRCAVAFLDRLKSYMFYEADMLKAWEAEEPKEKQPAAEVFTAILSSFLQALLTEVVNVISAETNGLDEALESIMIQNLAKLHSRHRNGLLSNRDYAEEAEAMKNAGRSVKFNL